MLARSTESPAALAQLWSAAMSPAPVWTLLTWLQKPSTAPWPWLAATPPRAAVSAAAAVHPAPAVSAQAAAQSPDVIAEAVLAIRCRACSSTTSTYCLARLRRSRPARAPRPARTPPEPVHAAAGITAGLGAAAASQGQDAVNRYCAQVNNAQTGALGDVSALQSWANAAGMSLDLVSALGSIGDPLSIVQSDCSLEQGVNQLGSDTLSCFQDASIPAFSRIFGWGGCGGSNRRPRSPPIARHLPDCV